MLYRRGKIFWFEFTIGGQRFVVAPGDELYYPAGAISPPRTDPVESAKCRSVSAKCPPDHWCIVAVPGTLTPPGSRDGPAIGYNVSAAKARYCCIGSFPEHVISITDMEGGLREKYTATPNRRKSGGNMNGAGRVRIKRACGTNIPDILQGG